MSAARSLAAALTLGTLLLLPGTATALQTFRILGTSSVLVDAEFTEGGPVYPSPHTDLTLTEDGTSGSLHFLTVEDFFIPLTPAGAGTWSFSFGAGGSLGSTVDLKLTWDDSTGHFFTDVNQDGTADALTVHGEFGTIVPQKSADWAMVFTTDEVGQSLPTACGSNTFTTPPDGTGIAPGIFTENAALTLAASACAQDFTGGAGLDEAGLIVHLNSIIPVPEPSTVLQVAAGLLGLGLLGRRRQLG